MPDYDVVIIGAGIAGASLAAEIAPHCRVVIAEAEDRPGYHATGRSAAFWAESYGGPKVQPLTTASGPWLQSPPPGYGDRSFLAPRGALTLARADELHLLDAFEADFDGSGVRMERRGRAALEAMVPGLAPDIVAGSFEPDCRDIDVGALHQTYLAAARRAGAAIALRSPLIRAERDDGVWTLSLGIERVSATYLVNAAGAWADRVAERAQVRPLGVQPFRRTVLQLRTAPQPPADLPLTLGVRGDYYFKPEAGRLWLSPHDETPEDPADTAPDELDMAIAIHRFGEVVDWTIEAVEHRWAGQRSFAPDRLPLIGFASDCPSFFWFAGQGGFGIQTAPAAAKLAAAILLGITPDAMLRDVDAQLYNPARLG
ncbi:FAD-binding oxidoreductase [Blastomonas sp.]|uniref:NAD(P)/FAD-dependent oxidoreductase n=1 Tax=Blastomonas sp. TaxID=1909299 RepID=UPI00262D3A30|nr:FAD-binding oxidoreductase [Blastomonas sp.]MDM7955027.1 FAD-binding oxidoreductase [Blastomonas sp.]